jgi:hypothetical protein
MKKLLLLLILGVSTAYAQIEKMNIYVDNSPNPQAISIIDINMITFDVDQMIINTKDGDQQFSVKSINKINFTPPAMNIEVYFNMHNGSVITYKTSEFDELKFAFINSVKDNGESYPGEVSFTKGSPNPFSDKIDIEFNIEKPGFVEASITDINGRILKPLLSDKLDKGSHSLSWDGTSSDGINVSPGSYICSVRLNNIVVSKKLIFVK